MGPTVWILSLLLTISLCILRTEGVGTVWFEFSKYVNPGGRGANGQCCDGKWGVCQANGCDHKFKFCLDFASSTSGTSLCAYGVKRSELPIKNRNTILFGSSIGVLPNPMGFQFKDALPDSIAFKIKAMDCDTMTGDDLVDNLRTNLNLRDPMIQGRGKDVVLNGRTAMWFRVWVSCEPQWYDELCNVYCPSPLEGEHYTCHPNDGSRICDPGWHGNNCDEEDIVLCEHNVCLYEAPCHIKKGVDTCICPDFANGLYCENHICDEKCTEGECLQSPQSPRDYICRCAEGYEVYLDDDGFEFCAPILTQPPKTTTTSVPPPSTTVAIINRENADCDRLFMNGLRESGVQIIHPLNSKSFRVYCDVGTEGWTVIQRRINNDLSFYRDWEDYKQGFGVYGINENFWLGLEHIYHLTNQRRYKLLIRMQMANSMWRTAEYDHFWIEGEGTNYKLHVNGFHGDAGNALEFRGDNEEFFHQGMAFSTYDHDNDKSNDNCAQKFQSGWWFNNCQKANLNGLYIERETTWPPCLKGRCVSWSTIPFYSKYSLVNVEMKILPNPRY